MGVENMSQLLLVILAGLCGLCTAAYMDTNLISTAYLRNVTCTRSKSFEPTCQTEKCARYVVDGVFLDEDIIALHAIANKGLSFRPDVGGPTIIDINTGYVRDSNGLINLFTLDQAVYTNEDFAHYGNIIRKLKSLVMSTFGISTLYFTAPTFITRLDGRDAWEPQAVHDEYWHVHADMNNTAHYQYSGLLYMSTYGKDFSGGKIHFVSKDDHSVIEDTIEPRIGRALIFSSDAENPHFVERLLTGQRFVLAFWFSCDPAREFEIFLDGEAHTTFSHNIKSRIKQQSSHQASATETTEKVAKRKRHRKHRSNEL